jgi:hypothetical protein
VGVLFLALVCLVAAKPLVAADPPVLGKLISDYQAARADVLGKLNESYALQADAQAKQYLQLSDLNGANRAADFSKRLRDKDEKNDLDGISGNAPATDRLAALQANYARAREETLRKVDEYYYNAGQNLQREYMRGSDLAGANSTAAFLDKIKPGAAPISAETTLTKGRNLLSKDNEHKWKQGKGDWRIENGVMTGAGDSETLFADTISAPFTLQFKINVLEGTRPRVRIGPVEFANEGYKTTFGLYPDAEAAKLFPYQHNTIYKVSIVASHKSVELFIDDKPIMSRPGLKDRVDKLTFSAGDGWSKGRVEYRDIVLIK